MKSLNTKGLNKENLKVKFKYQIGLKMLIRPPFMKQEDVKSQSSNTISHMDRQPSVKSNSKNKKKQNSLGMRKNNMIGMQYEANDMLNAQNNYDSDNGSVHSVNSRKSKGKTKESTLAIGKKDSSYVNNNKDSSYANNNQNSPYSIKDQQQQYEIFKLDSDQDNKSVGSHASKNSRKNTLKENSLGKNHRNSRVNVQLNYYKDNNNKNLRKQEKQDTPPKTYYLEEESKVQTVRLSQDPSPQPTVKYNQALKTNPITAKNPQQKARRTQHPKPKQALSPFQEITLKRQSDEEEPVYKLKQPQPTLKNYSTTPNNIFGQKPTQKKISQQKQSNPTSQQNQSNTTSQQYQSNPFMQRNAFAQKVKTENQIDLESKKLKIDLQQSSTIQPQMISTKSVTKSRRNKIFDDNNNSIANTSNINTSRTNMEGSFERSRSKSKSKLGDLLKQSRQKKEQLVKSKEKQVSTKPTKVFSPLDNKNFENNHQRPKQVHHKQSYESAKNLMAIQNSNLVSVSTLHEQSRIGGQKLGEHPVKMQQIKPKTVQNEVFDLGQSRQSHLELNLSMSNRQPELSGIKGDSVHFNFEPERKKGLTLTSKQKSSSNQNKSLESKKHLDRLMKKCQQNEQFLAKSILSNNSELRTSQKSVIQNARLPEANKRQETLNRPFEKVKEKKTTQDQPGQYEMVKDDPAFQIKQVERKQIRRPSQQQIRLQQKQKQSSQQYVPTSTAKGPQQLFGNPLSRQGSQQLFSQAPISKEQNFYRQQIDQQLARQQKNIILVNIQKKSKTQKQTQNTQIPIKKPASKPEQDKNQRREDQMIQKREDQTGQRRDKQTIQRREDQMAQRTQDTHKERIIPLKHPQAQYVKEQGQSSTISHELSLSENGSDRSNSQKKNKKKQSSLNIMKKHKVQVRDQSPRAEQSFYEQHPENVQYQKSKSREQVRDQQKTFEVKISPKMQSGGAKMQSSRTKVQYKKPNVINFQESEGEEKVKSKTDINFYNYGEMSQKSMRPPSSKPPLSRKSGASSSKSKSKAKQSTLNINMTKKDNKIKINNDGPKAKSNGNKGQNNGNKGQSKPQQKSKKTLLEIAQDKSYEGSGYGGSDSQCSFNSRESFGSVNSKGSRKSSTSKKQSTLPITIKNKTTTMGNFHPSLNKMSSTSSQVQIYQNQQQNQSIYNKLGRKSTKRNSKQRQHDNVYEQMQQQRTIVSKDTYFIDERGRLVKQDLVIQGNKVYGRNGNQSVEQMAIERMKRSRQHHRSRSKSRDGSRSRLSKKNSMTSFGADSHYADSRASSSNYFNGQQSNYNQQKHSNHFNGHQTNYNHQKQNNNQQKQNLYIEEFIKPVQQPFLANNYKFQKPLTLNQRKIQTEFYQNQQDPYNGNHYRDHYQQQQDQDDEEPVRNITLNQLFGRNKNQPTNNLNPKTMYNQQASNLNLYTNYNNERSKYTNTNNSKFNGHQPKFNGQQSRQSNRKKSLSRTEKTFHNR